MKNKGYIYIFTIMIISLMAILFYFIYSYVEKSAIVNFNRIEKINAKYMAESVLNIVIAEENFNEELRDFTTKELKSIKLNQSINLEDTQILKLNLVKESIKDKDIIEIDTNIKYKNTVAAAKIRANYINKIYEEVDGILNSSKLDPDKLEEIKNKFENHNYNNSGFNVLELSGNFKIDFIKGNTYIIEEVDEYDAEKNEIIKKDKIIREVKISDIIYQKSGTLEIKKEARLGILIINDKVMFNDNNLFGIIVLNNEAEIYNNCKIQGYLIDLYDRNTSISTNYYYPIIKSFGKALPEFIKFQPISLNHYDLEN